MRDENTRKLAGWGTTALAVFGLISLGSNFIGKTLDIVGSLLLTGVGAFGAAWLWHQAQERQYKSIDTALAVGLIVVVLAAFYLFPEAFPRTFSLFRP